MTRVQLALAPTEPSTNLTSRNATLLPDPEHLPVLHEAEWQFHRALMQEFHRRHIQGLDRRSTQLPEAS